MDSFGSFEIQKKVANKEIDQAKEGHVQNHENHDSEDDINIEDTDDEEANEEEEIYKTWVQSRRPAIPEPSFKNTKYAREPKKLLAEKFRDSGLQAIVKMASIELTPEKPEFHTGGWHVNAIP